MDEETRRLIRDVAREAIREYVIQSREFYSERDMYESERRGISPRRFERNVDRFNMLVSRFEDGLDLWANQGCSYEKSKIESIKNTVEKIDKKP